MATYLAFLRAINLGATRRFPKAAIIEAVEGAGFSDVATHINTGNVRFGTRMRSRARIEAALEEAFAEAAGFEVPTIVFTRAELRDILEAAQTYDHPGRHYISLLKESPTAASVRRFEEHTGTEDVGRVGGRAVHLMLGSDYHAATLTNATVEKHLGVATNRNLTVIRTIVEKWC